MALRMRYLEILKNRLNRSPRSDVSVALQLHLNKLNAAVIRVSGEDSPNPQTRESCNAVSYTHLSDRFSVSFSMQNVLRISSMKRESGTAYPFNRSFLFTLSARL